MLRKYEGGFTLIEIVLVLAIAGLILAMAFIGISGAQKNRRDTQRKQDLQRLGSAAETYASNNHGSYPTADADPATGFLGGFETGFLPDKFNDPSTLTGYVMGTGFGTSCNPAAAMAAGGPGYISYGVPGASGPFRLRMCLEQGEYDIGN